MYHLTQSFSNANRCLIWKLSKLTHWQCEGKIKQTATIPGLINCYYREKPEA